MNGEPGRDQEEHEDAEVRCELADQGGQRIAAGRLQPFAEVARAELRSHGIACGYGDHDMQDGRQDRAQQELGVVQGRIGQHVLFDDQRARRIARRRRRRQIGGAGRNRSGQGRGRDVAGREILLVVEDDDLRPLARGDVALEVARQIDRRERLAGTDGVHGGAEVGRSPGDIHARRGIQGLDIGHRRLRVVLVDDIDTEVADDGVAEGERQQHDGEKRHADHERQGDAVAPDPQGLAYCDFDEPRTERSRHQGRLFQSA